MAFWHLRGFPQHICDYAMQQLTCCNLKFKNPFGYSSITFTEKTKLSAGVNESHERVYLRKHTYAKAPFQEQIMTM